jgi:hypothetical protein
MAVSEAVDRDSGHEAGTCSPVCDDHAYVAAMQEIMSALSTIGDMTQETRH